MNTFCVFLRLERLLFIYLLIYEKNLPVSPHISISRIQLTKRRKAILFINPISFFSYPDEGLYIKAADKSFRNKI